MTTRFSSRKQKILEQLDVPDGEYQDLSPKGSLDAPIRDLIGEINHLQGLVTTSSCSGRVSVFLEGNKAEGETVESASERQDSRAGPGGKGGGGSWLFISHDPMEKDTISACDLTALFGLERTTSEEEVKPPVWCRYIHLKFEPMILHVLSACMEDAQRVLNAALTAGFRESGAVSLSSTKMGETNPMVAIRSAGYSFDSIIGYQDANGRNLALVDETYLHALVDIANERFKINIDRIARFRNALLQLYYPKASESGSSKPDWEDADARKQRKREEGLRRQQALQKQDNLETQVRSSVADLESIDSMFS